MQLRGRGADGTLHPARPLRALCVKLRCRAVGCEVDDSLLLEVELLVVLVRSAVAHQKRELLPGAGNALEGRAGPATPVATARA